MPNAVLVVDMLRGFLEEGYNLYCGEGARRIIPEVQAILEREKARGSSIFYICDTHEPDDLEFKMFPVHCVKGTAECDVIPELEAYPGERISKQRYSAFYNTDLEQRLRELAPDRIIVCGVCTDICVHAHYGGRSQQGLRRRGAHRRGGVLQRGGPQVGAPAYGEHSGSQRAGV